MGKYYSLDIFLKIESNVYIQYLIDKNYIKDYSKIYENLKTRFDINDVIDNVILFFLDDYKISCNYYSYICENIIDEFLKEKTCKYENKLYPNNYYRLEQDEFAKILNYYYIDLVLNYLKDNSDNDNLLMDKLNFNKYSLESKKGRFIIPIDSNTYYKEKSKIYINYKDIASQIDEFIIKFGKHNVKICSKIVAN